MNRKRLAVCLSLFAAPSTAGAQLPLVDEGASGWVARLDDSWIDGQVGLDLDGQGRPHVVYGVFNDDVQPNRWELWYQRWDPISRRWLPDTPLVEDIACDAYPDIAVEADGTAHIVYCDGSEDDNQQVDPFGPMYCTVEPGAVACSERVLVHQGSRDWRGGHGIALDAAGTPVVVFQDAYTGEMWFEKESALLGWGGAPDPVFTCSAPQNRCCLGLSKPSLDLGPGDLPAVSCGNIDNFVVPDGAPLPGPPPVVNPGIQAAWKNGGAWAYDADPPNGDVGGPWIQAFAIGADAWLAQTWYDGSVGQKAVKYRQAKLGTAWSADQIVEAGLTGGFGAIATDLKVEDSAAIAVAYNDWAAMKSLRYARWDAAQTAFVPGFVDGHCEDHTRWLDLELSADADEAPRVFYRTQPSHPADAADAKYMAWDDDPWPFEQPGAPSPGALLDGAVGAASDRIDPGAPDSMGDRWICYREVVGFPQPAYDLYLVRWDGKDRAWDAPELIKASVGPAPDDKGRHCAVSVWEAAGGGSRTVAIAYAYSSGPGWDLQFRHSVDGGPWAGPAAVGQTIGHLDMAHLASGRAAIGFVNSAGEPAYAEVWHAGIWNTQTAVVRPGLGGAGHLSVALDQPRQQPRLTFSVGGALHLVWPKPLNNMQWPAVAANEHVWAGESAVDTSLLIVPCCPPGDAQCAVTAPECADVHPGTDLAGKDVYAAFRDSANRQVKLHACAGLPADPPANCDALTIDDGTHELICGVGTSCDVGAYLDGELDGHWTPSYSYRNYTLAQGGPLLPDLGLVSTRWNVADGGWAVCDTAKGGHQGALSLDRYGNPLVGSTDFTGLTPLRGFWWP